MRTKLCVVCKEEETIIKKEVEQDFNFDNYFGPEPELKPESESESTKPVSDKTLWIFLKYLTAANSSSDFNEDANSFYFCSKCTGLVDKLVNLEDQLELIKSEINKVVAQLSCIIIQTEDCDNSVKICRGDENLPVFNFRREVYQQFIPNIIVPNCQPRKRRKKKPKKNKESSSSSSHVENGLDKFLQDLGQDDEGQDYDEGLSDLLDHDWESDTSVPPKRKRGKKGGQKVPNFLKRKRKRKSVTKVKDQSDPDKKTEKRIERPVEISENVFCLSGKWSYEKVEVGFKCLTCGAKGHNTTAMHRHINLKHNTDWTSCEACGWSWRDPKKFEEHVCRPKAKKRITSKKVGIGKYLYNGLPFEKMSEAERTESGGFEYKCGTCNAMSKCRGSMNAHLRQRHMDVTRYCCDECGRVFTNLRSFENHKWVHTDEGPKKDFLCTQCGKTFRTRNLLNYHQAFHLDPSVRHACHICGVSFRYENGLRRHRVNTGHFTSEQLLRRQKRQEQLGQSSQQPLQPPPPLPPLQAVSSSSEQEHQTTFEQRNQQEISIKNHLHVDGAGSIPQNSLSFMPTTNNTTTLTDPKIEETPADLSLPGFLFPGIFSFQQNRT